MKIKKAWLTIPLLLVACGVEPRATNGSSTPGSTTPDSITCDGFRGQATVAEIGLVPFTDPEAEVLAIEASAKLVAPRHVYERILADLALIRARNAPLRNLVACPSWVPDELILDFDAEGLTAIQAGTYTDWNCPNALYGVTSKEDGSSFTLLRFGRRFNTPLLAAAYQALAHVRFAEANAIAGDSDDICVSIEKETTYHYIFDAGSGACPAGCTHHEYWGFTTTKDAPGAVAPLGTFSRDSPDPPPAWFAALPNCTKWL